MSRNVILDGYTEEGYIAAADRLNDELRFTYRPLYGGDADHFSSRDFQMLDAKRKAYEESKAIAEHLVSWSEMDKDGKPLPITDNNVGRLPSPVRNKLLNIIGRWVPSDIPPGGMTPKQDDEFQRFLEAQKSGKAPAVAIAEADAKN